MPHEHAALCLICGPAASHLGPETTGYPDWKASPKDSGRGIRWRYHHLYNDTEGRTCHKWCDTMLPKSHGSSPEHTEIEGPGRGRIGYIHGYAEHTIPRWNKDSRRQLRSYHRALNEQGVGERNRQGESPGKGYIWAVLKPFITDSLRASLPPSENGIRPRCTRQLTTAIAWYIWKGATFPVPISTLQKS